MLAGRMRMAAGASAVASSLLDNLVSYWKLDEAGGTRTDSHGSNHLTDNNTVLSAVGKVGNAADFEQVNSESLSIADNADLSVGDIDFTFAAWVRAETLPVTSAYILGKDNGGTNLEYGLFYRNTSNRFRFYVSGNGSAVTVVESNTFGALTTATWYFVVTYHDATNNEIGISVNNGAFDTAAHTTGVRDGTNALRLGSHAAGGVYFDGLIDEVGLWKRVLAADEITSLWNGGAGTTYPF